MRADEVDWKEVERWSLVRIEWLDIMEATGANPEDARLATRVEHRLFYGVLSPAESPHGVETLVVALTHDEGDSPTQAGWGAYPTSVVLDFEVIERPGQKKRRKRSLTPRKKAAHARAEDASGKADPVVEGSKSGS